MNATAALGFLPLATVLLSMVGAEETPSYLTYDNTPLGTVERPLVLRTYMPDPGLADDVFAHHGTSAPSPKYNIAEGKDVAGEDLPVKGIPAAIGVNHGAALSYCFDTTECRLLYAWQGGFLDMFPYWGDQARGNRQAYNYVPHLMGNLFHLTSGQHPVHLDGKSISESGVAPKFLGYSLVNSVPQFRYQVGAHTIVIAFSPGASNEILVSLSSHPAADLDYRPGGKPAPRKEGVSPLLFHVRGEVLASYQGFPRDMKITTADAASGEKLYLNYGCVACHSTDGSAGHGPTFGGLFGRTRPVEGGLDVLADEAYLLESIKSPNARTAQGFPPGYMPPYQLKEIESQALVAFIKSLGRPE